MFTKTNQTGFDDALTCEAEGLAVLAKAVDGSGLSVPSVSKVDGWEIEMTAIDGCPGDQDHHATLGQGLADLHRQHQPQYGWHRDNYIGLNPQANALTENWGAFFTEYRLARQIQMIEPPAVRKAFRQRLEHCQATLEDFLNAYCQHPSLVHGDLWSGNVMFDAHGQVWLIDPAVYFGDREVDLAMTEMFGGFASAFYQHYDACYPRSAQYPVKREIYNLYHYLNHYNLFGEVYLGGCERGLLAVEQL
ncbi:fructosamine kinase family protein [Spongiibacter taiwanensis]|uniref:fructosamine kinase family protein n=1 Tax=Spongiibacter taiwanensis TaxID=1748242 RepID=UPI00203591C5|nr:fructosamine kinase family protein [Spongiibacter taiwanensis]USA44422.1 fructosamine kinase family protein [Spongiibacter taiwanensis]